MGKTIRILFFICFVVLLVAVLTRESAWAEQPQGATVAKGEDSWHFLIAPYGWLTGLQGGAEGKQGRKADLNIGLSDAVELIDEIEFALMGRIEIEKGRWGFIFDGACLKLEDSADFEKDINIPIVVPSEITIQGRVEVTSVLSVYQAALSYDVYRSRNIVGKRQELVIEAMAGARYNYLRTRIDLDVAGLLQQSAEGSKNWTDPIVGGRLLWMPHERWQLSFEADAGGFGVGSDFSSNLNAGAMYQINEWLLVNGGYRALYNNYDKNQFKYDAWMYGPWLGIAFEF